MRDYTRQFTHIKLNSSQYRLILIGVLVVLLWIIWFMVEPWPLWVRIANVGSRTLSVAWVTEKPTRGCALLVEKDWLPVIKRVCEPRYAKVHLVDFTDLIEYQNYRVWVVQGGRLYLGSYKSAQTYITKPNPPAPAPAYGSVVDLNGKQVPNALVYIYPANGGELYPEATIANDQGNYALDLGYYVPIEEWVVEGGSGPEQWDVRFAPGKSMTPFPSLEVSVHE
jgi:hypothetical protein